MPEIDNNDFSKIPDKDIDEMDMSKSFLAQDEVLSPQKEKEIIFDLYEAMVQIGETTKEEKKEEVNQELLDELGPLDDDFDEFSEGQNELLPEEKNALEMIRNIPQGTDLITIIKKYNAKQLEPKELKKYEGLIAAIKNLNQRLERNIFTEIDERADLEQRASVLLNQIAGFHSQELFITQLYDDFISTGEINETEVGDKIKQYIDLELGKIEQVNAKIDPIQKQQIKERLLKLKDLNFKDLVSLDNIGFLGLLMEKNFENIKLQETTGEVVNNEEKELVNNLYTEVIKKGGIDYKRINKDIRAFLTKELVKIENNTEVYQDLKPAEKKEMQEKIDNIKDLPVAEFLDIENLGFIGLLLSRNMGYFQKIRNEAERVNGKLDEKTPFPFAQREK
jgi:hypothetical protein